MKGPHLAGSGGRMGRVARRGWLWGVVLAAAACSACSDGNLIGTAGSVRAAASPVELALLRWPWGPRVQVGERTFRIDVRPDPRRPVKLVVWDVGQPPGPGRSGWKEVLEQAVAPLRQAYPALEVAFRVLSWQELDAELEQALRRATPPDILGTPEVTYLYDPRWQVPIEGYLAHALDPQQRAELLPGAAALTAAGGHLWGLPRWVEWAGWAVRPQGGGARVAIDLANPLTWRLLVLSAATSDGGTPAGGPTGGASIWSAGRLRQAQAWLQSLQPHRVPAARVAQLGPVELLLRGEAAAAGPLTGRLAFRLGAWPGGGAASRHARAGLLLAAMLAVEGVAAQLPGALVSASSYVLFAPPQADDARLRLAWELAVALARQSARALAGSEGVIAAWNPRTRPAGSGGPHSGGSRQAAEPPWWERYAFPPGAREALLAGGGPWGSAPGGRGPSGRWTGGRTGSGGGGPEVARDASGIRPVVAGALDWSDGLHERTVVARWAPQLASGRVRLEEFVRQVSR